MPTDEKLLEKANTAFIRARISLLNTKPFWAHLLLKMPVVWADASRTMGVSCTDGESIFITPETYVTLPRDEQVSVLVHEVAHCIAGHLWRCGSRNQRKFNIAGDVWIQNMLEGDGFTPIAVSERALQGMGIDRELFKDMATEAIYDKLPDPPQQSKGHSQDKGKGSSQASAGQGGGGHQHWNGDGCYQPCREQAKASSLEKEWRGRVVEAGQVAGNAPGAWQELVKAAMPKVPFHLKLFEYLNRGMGGDSSFDHLNRRYIGEGMYFPSDTRRVMGRVAWVADTSGSMGQEELKLAFGYFRTFRYQHPCQADLICCDYDVASHKTFEEWTPLPEQFEASGRGGTSFDAPFAMLKKKKIEPCVLIYVTDGYGSVGCKPPAYPVLWVVVGGNDSFKPPFGEVCCAAPGEKAQ